MLANFVGYAIGFKKIKSGRLYESKAVKLKKALRPNQAIPNSDFYTISLSILHCIKLPAVKDYADYKTKNCDAAMSNTYANTYAHKSRLNVLLLILKGN